MANEKNLEKRKKFTSKNQPDPELKSKGWKKKMLLKDIAEQIVKGGAVDDLKPIADYLGVSQENIDVETLMHLSQISKAIQKKDTQAYNAVLDRLKGKPMQAIDHTTKGDKVNNAFKIEIVDSTDEGD